MSLPLIFFVDIKFLRTKHLFVYCYVYNVPTSDHVLTFFFSSTTLLPLTDTNTHTQPVCTSKNMIIDGEMVCSEIILLIYRRRKLVTFVLHILHSTYIHFCLLFSKFSMSLYWKQINTLPMIILETVRVMSRLCHQLI